MNAASFLEVLFGDAVSPEAKLVVFQETGKRADYFDNIPAAVAFTASVHHKTNTYFGVCLHDEAKAKAESKAKPEYARGCARSALVVGGVWMDIDIRSEKHTKPRLAPSLNVIVDGLNGLPIKPSFLNTTGGGVHAWYMFREPWVLESDKERARAQSLVEGFQRYVDKACDFAVDATWDLARVLRLPGSINLKHKHPITVTCSQPFSPLPRYNPSDFDDYAAKPRSLIKIEPTQPLQIDAAAEVPQKFLVLLSLEVELHAAWTRKLPPAKTKGWSDSEWDMSLASRLVERPEEENWTDQEILDVLMAHRRMHGNSMDRKNFNAEKFAFTIAKARAQKKQKLHEEYQVAQRLVQLDQITANIEEISRQIDQQPITQEVALAPELATPVLADEGLAPVPAAPAVTAFEPLRVELQNLQAAGFAVINELLEIPKDKALLRLIRYDGDEGTYVLRTNAGTVKLGSIDFLHYPDKFAQRLGDGIQFSLRPIKSSEWRGADGIYPRLLKLVERVALDFGGELDVSLSVILRKYIEQGIQEKRDDALLRNLPFIYEGEVWGGLEGIMNAQNSLPQGFHIFKYAKDLGIAFRRLDMLSKDFNFVNSTDTHGKPVSKTRLKRAAWKLTSEGRLVVDCNVDVLGIRRDGD